MARELPRWMHFKHGRYYLVKNNKWRPLSRDRHDALVEYARLTTVSDDGALQELVLRALAYMKPSIKPSTYKNYVTCSRRVIEAFADFSPKQIRPGHVVQFLDDYRDTPSMGNLLLSFLHGVFVQAVRWEIIPFDPSRDIKKFKTKGRDRLISDHEWKVIKANASPTLSCLMDMAYLTGQRISDVMEMKYSQISVMGIYVKQGKTDARQLILMTPELEAVIRETKMIHNSPKANTLFHKPNGSPLSYNTIYGHWRRACAGAGVEAVGKNGAHFHDIRANAATEADEAGIDSRALLGHTTESSHQRYLRSKKVNRAVPLPVRKG